MISEAVVILGIPLDNLTMGESIERIFSMIEAYGKDKRPRLVATVNVDFVVNTLAWRLSRSRHPELMEILRYADLVTADGMPLVVLSRLLGSPLKERVTGADLVPRLAKEAGERGKSIYCLGGRNGVGLKAASLLQEKYPKLIIAGIDAPFVHIEGQGLADADQEDRTIVERINKAGPDILLIAFGNPKQEIWFNRNRNRLRVPVSIGIGGTFEFIAGSVRRAPAWMQKAGIEWLFRISQDPWRLWKRYFVGFFKFGLMVWPAVLYYRYRSLHYRLFQKRQANLPEERRRKTAPALGCLNVVVLPARLDLVSLERLSEEVGNALTGASKVVLDFAQVTFIDSTGLAFLIRSLRNAEREGDEIYFVKVGSKARRFFELNRTWDLFKERSWRAVDEVLTHLEEAQKLPLFYYLMTHRSEATLLDLFGRLDAQQLKGLDMTALISAIGDKSCILNLDRLTFVDSSGLIFFFKIQKHLAGLGKSCVLCALTDNVKQLFRLTKLDRLFRITSDIPSAEELLEKPA
jgi:N-acetylglucosaminyldiphosphoundecaprenol N-acetyl-beta-D-mannosaminyltransferase